MVDTFFCIKTRFVVCAAADVAVAVELRLLKPSSLGQAGWKILCEAV